MQNIPMLNNISKCRVQDLTLHWQTQTHSPLSNQNVTELSKGKVSPYSKPGFALGLNSSSFRTSSMNSGSRLNLSELPFVK